MKAKRYCLKIWRYDDLRATIFDYSKLSREGSYHTIVWFGQAICQEYVSEYLTTEVISLSVNR